MTFGNSNLQSANYNLKKKNHISQEIKENLLKEVEPE